MKVMMEVELMPFRVPDHAVLVKEPGLKQDGFPGVTTQGNIPFNMMSKDALILMCKQFTESVLEKGGYVNEELKEEQISRF